jgi:hypothetical protein
MSSCLVIVKLMWFLNLLEKWIYEKWFCFEKHGNIFVGVHEFILKKNSCDFV